MDMETETRDRLNRQRSPEAGTNLFHDNLLIVGTGNSPDFGIVPKTACGSTGDSPTIAQTRRVDRIGHRHRRAELRMV